MPERHALLAAEAERLSSRFSLEAMPDLTESLLSVFAGRAPRTALDGTLAPATKPFGAAAANVCLSHQHHGLPASLGLWASPSAISLSLISAPSLRTTHLPARFAIGRQKPNSPAFRISRSRRLPASQAPARHRISPSSSAASRHRPVPPSGPYGTVAASVDHAIRLLVCAEIKRPSTARSATPRSRPPEYPGGGASRGSVCSSLFSTAFSTGRNPGCGIAPPYAPRSPAA